MKEELHKEINDLKEQLEIKTKQLSYVEKEELRQKEALKFWQENSNVSMISEDYTINPEEMYNNLESKFIKNFSLNDKETNIIDLKEYEKEYIETLEKELNQLKELIEELKNET